MTHLCYFDPLFEAVARKAAIVDVIEDLLGPNIKLYCDQLMMKARYHGTVTDWHQDSVAWPQFAPQDHVSCWVALDDATVENGCMTVLPGSHKWGPINSAHKARFLDNPLIPEPMYQWNCRLVPACSTTASTSTARVPIPPPTGGAA